MRIWLLVALGALVLSCAPGPTANGDKADGHIELETVAPVSAGPQSCIPASRLVGPPDGVEIRGTLWSATFRLLVIGCRTELDALTEAELKTIENRVVETISGGLDIAGMWSRQREFRIQLANEINTVLGRAAIHEIYLLDFVNWERRMRRPRSP